MAFMIIGKDKKNSLEIRLNNREEHLKYLQSGKIVVKLAGPIMENGNMAGSIWIFEGTKEEVENFVKGDPYVKSGLFESMEILDMKIVLANF